MGVFRLLPHTADIRLFVTAGTQEDLFRTALKGMAELQKKGFCKKNNSLFDCKEQVHVKATDQTSLLVDFLSDVLTLSHIKKAVYCDAIFHKMSLTEITATIQGKKSPHLEEDLKAVTYHEAEIRQNKDNGLETIIIFDI